MTKPDIASCVPRHTPKLRPLKWKREISQKAKPQRRTPVSAARFGVSLLAFCGALCGLLACQFQSTPSKPALGIAQPAPFLPLTEALACLSKTGPVIALHRGRDKGRDDPENALLSLKAAAQQGLILAEIDIAQLSDGTLILFHDGVWDEKSTGKGAVARSKAADLDQILLLSPRGKFTDSRPPTLDSVLRWADRRFYFELDLKTSVNEARLVEAVRGAGMARHVLLISYDAAQAQRLSKLAPDMMISLPPSAAKVASRHKAGVLFWLGTETLSQSDISAARGQGAFSAYGQFLARNQLPSGWEDLTVLVTDYASELSAKIGQKKTDAARLADCSAAN